MKKFLVYIVAAYLSANVNVFAGEKRGILDKIEGGLDTIFGKEVETISDMKSKRKNKISKNETSKHVVVSKPCKEIKRGSLEKKSKPKQI